MHGEVEMIDIPNLENKSRSLLKLEAEYMTELLPNLNKWHDVVVPTLF